MKKKNLNFWLFILFNFMIMGVNADVGLDSIYPETNIEIIQNTFFNFTANISCFDFDCENIKISLMIPVLEEVEYFHNGSLNETDKDCFDETNNVCITRGPIGSPYNLGSDIIQIGWGNCDDVSDWYFMNNEGWKAIKNKKLGGGQNMPLIVNNDLCFNTSSNGKWDVVFSSWESGGEFEYTRIQERDELISSEIQEFPFYIDGNNPQIINLNAEESKSIIFLIKATGEIGSDYDFVLFVDNEKNSEINVKIIAFFEEDEENKYDNEGDEDEDEDERRHRWYNYNDDYFEEIISYSEPIVEQEIESEVQKLGNSKITSNVIGSNSNTNKIFLVVFLSFIILLIILIITLLLIKQ